VNPASAVQRCPRESVYAGPPELIRTGLKLAAGLTIRVAVFEPLSVAVIVTETEEVTDSDVTVNVAEVALAGTVTLAGTVAEGLLLDSVTTVPPGSPKPLRVTVPIELAPPTTVVGFNVKDDRPVAAGTTVSVAVTERLSVAVITEVAEEVTVCEVIENVAEVALAATITEGGTVVADVLLLDKFTTAPPAGAAVLSVTVPVELAMPPTTVFGFNDSDETAIEF